MLTWKPKTSFSVWNPSYLTAESISNKWERAIIKSTKLIKYAEKIIQISCYSRKVMRNYMMSITTNITILSWLMNHSNCTTVGSIQISSVNSRATNLRWLSKILNHYLFMFQKIETHSSVYISSINCRNCISRTSTFTVNCFCDSFCFTRVYKIIKSISTISLV